MGEYEFTLRFDISQVAADIDDCVESLGAGGCDDATIGVGIPGRLALMFARDAASAEDAVITALRDVETALPEAILFEAAPDFVGITEVADIMGKTRQNMRKLLLSCSAGTPLPIHEGSSSIWHLAPVLEWLRDEKQYAIDPALIDLARTNMQLNAATARIPVSPRIRTDVESYLAEA
jgi:hypothetical protein